MCSPNHPSSIGLFRTTNRWNKLDKTILNWMKANNFADDPIDLFDNNRAIVAICNVKKCNQKAERKHPTILHSPRFNSQLTINQSVYFLFHSKWAPNRRRKKRIKNERKHCTTTTMTWKFFGECLFGCVMFFSSRAVIGWLSTRHDANTMKTIVSSSINIIIDYLLLNCLLFFRLIFTFSVVFSVFSSVVFGFLCRFMFDKSGFNAFCSEQAINKRTSWIKSKETGQQNNHH